jgi:antirestriction protein ArdC
MPARSRFEDASAYDATLLHELAHWTGHASRLDRNLSGRFGSERYAAEELVAELAAAFLCADLGIDGRLQHAEYVASWLRVLRNDKRAIFTAARLAQQAADYLVANVGQIKAAGVIKEAA